MTGWEGEVAHWAAKRGPSPFASWFGPDGRAYVDFRPSTEGADDEIAKHFKDSEHEILDYGKGLLKDKYGRAVRIGKVLLKDEQDQLKQLQQGFAAGHFSKAKYDADVLSTKKYYRELRTAYETSPLRVGANDESPYQIVFSNNPTDIAAMSTNRAWDSCMELGSGSNHRSIWCEIKLGGFVAYLIKRDDKDIRKPVARIHIRRFDNKAKQSIAVPEDSVYGNEYPGFYDAVQEWIDQRQGKIRPGSYTRRGGYYSDTFGSATGKRAEQIQKRKRYFLPDEADAQLRFLEKNANKSGIKKHVAAAVDRAAKYLMAADSNLSDDQRDRLLAVLKKDPVLGQLHLRDFYRRYPSVVQDDEFTKMSHTDRLLLMKKRNDPRWEQLQHAIAEKKVTEELDVDNPKWPTKDGAHIGYKEASDIRDVLDEVGNLKPLTPTHIRHVVKFATDLLERYKGVIEDLKDKGKKPDNQIFNVLTYVLDALSNSGADTPEVIRLAQQLLPYYEMVGDDYSFGRLMAKLGRNGTPFLPFLQQRIQELEAKYERLSKIEKIPSWMTKGILDQVERARYIIDSIESGQGRSSKYKFY